MYGVYGALIALAWAAVLPCQTLMSLLKRTRPLPLRERLGILEGPVGGGGFWIHAVSVGEMRLALRIVPELRRRFPGAAVHVSTGTPTGRALGSSGAGAAAPDSIGALPIDLPFAMSRLLDRLRPRAVLIVETEIWPNLLRLCAARGVPVLLVNGRISQRSFPRYRALRRFARRVLPGFRALGMQSREDGDRIVALGAPADRVVVTGNVKFDLEPAAGDPAALRRRLGLAVTRTLFVAGSTSPGEERPVLRAYAHLRAADPGARLVLAPRHPENFAAAERAARQAGLGVVSWSALDGVPGDGPEGPAWDVLVLDRMGILTELYAAADLVFVGGSLVPRGGQNLLEPAALGKPVLFGPLVDNFRAAADALLASGAGFVTRDGDEMGLQLVRLLNDRAGYRVASTMARRVVEGHRGAVLRTMRLIEEALPPTGSQELRAART